MADKDLLAAYAFLADGEDTPENRKALARLLRSPQPLYSEIREVLAILFDPPTSYSLRLTFGGRKSTKHRDLLIAYAVNQLRYDPERPINLKRAINIVGEKHKVQDTVVKDALRAHKHKFDRLEKALKARQKSEKKPLVFDPDTGLPIPPKKGRPKGRKST